MLVMMNSKIQSKDKELGKDTVDGIGSDIQWRW